MVHIVDPHHALRAVGNELTQVRKIALDLLVVVAQRLAVRIFVPLAEFIARADFDIAFFASLIGQRAEQSVSI